MCLLQKLTKLNQGLSKFDLAALLCGAATFFIKNIDFLFKRYYIIIVIFCRGCLITRDTKSCLAPSYLKRFQCKMGNCRTACCTGWQVSMSMGDYFHLLGIECRKELRDKIDVAVYPFDNPTKEKYARISHDYVGNCKLRMPDGRCYIQAELGEAALPDVCRMYPRAVRKSETWECSCANSCEAVVEEFIYNPAPIEFEILDYTTEYPDYADSRGVYDTSRFSSLLRKQLIELMQDKSVPIQQRLINIGKVLREQENPINDNESKEFSVLLKKNSDTDSARELACGLSFMNKLMEYIKSNSESLQAFAEEAHSCFSCVDNIDEQYKQAKNSFETSFPQHEIIVENLLVNHMFFSRFPCSDMCDNAFDEFLALCVVYALLRFLGIGCMVKECSKTKLADIYAAAFRLIDHTQFHKNAAKLMHLYGFTSSDQVFSLINL